jgi:hypothetical protein
LDENLKDHFSKEQPSPLIFSKLLFSFFLLRVGFFLRVELSAGSQTIIISKKEKEKKLKLFFSEKM